MTPFNPDLLNNLYTPLPNSHKGQNGKVFVIAGSKLFHAASLWSLAIASKIVDMVYYSSVEENNEIVKEAKEQFQNGIVVPRARIEDYIQEADSILIGPGLPRSEGKEEGDEDTKLLTEGLLVKYPKKRWVIDGGSLQTITPADLPQGAILTPHLKEFELLFGTPATEESITDNAKKYDVVILCKMGEKDVIASASECVEITGGNAGMTKGGTGDVLAGLVAALYSKNDAFLSACAASYINKKAGEKLFEKVGYYFNATDLVEEIPHVMKELLA